MYPPQQGRRAARHVLSWSGWRHFEGRPPPSIQNDLSRSLNCMTFCRKVSPLRISGRIEPQAFFPDECHHRNKKRTRVGAVMTDDDLVKLGFAHVDDGVFLAPPSADLRFLPCGRYYEIFASPSATATSSASSYRSSRSSLSKGEAMSEKPSAQERHEQAREHPLRGARQVELSLRYPPPVPLAVNMPLRDRNRRKFLGQYCTCDKHTDRS